MAVKTGVSMISKPGLISENNRLHELQCKLKERQAASKHKGR